MRYHRINVRLDPEEVEALRQNPGNTDSERIRSIIHTRSIADAISEPLEQRINELEQQQKKTNSELNRLRTVIENATDKMRQTGEALEIINKNVKRLIGGS